VLSALLKELFSLLSRLWSCNNIVRAGLFFRRSSTVTPAKLDWMKPSGLISCGAGVALKAGVASAACGVDEGVELVVKLHS
jgi:hypothetical protein